MMYVMTDLCDVYVFTCPQGRFDKRPHAFTEVRATCDIPRKQQYRVLDQRELLRNRCGIGAHPSHGTLVAPHARI